MKRIFASLALALALTGVVATSGAHADDTGTCEGTPPTYGHEWQGQSRTLIPEVEEVSHQVYSYKKKVEQFKTEHQYQKEVRGDVWQKDNGKKGQWHKTGQKFDWTWWTPASTKWSFNDVEVLESGPHNGVVKEWTEGNGKKLWRWISTEYRYVKNGTTRQVPNGYTWEYSGEVTEPRDAPWVLLDGYPRTEVTTEHVPAYYTEWADTGDVVRTDEKVAPEADTDTFRWVYVGEYVKVEATDPTWQDTDPEAPCFNGPEQPGPDYFTDRGEYMTCEGLFRWSEIFEIPYVWDGDAWVPGEPVSLEHLEDKVRDLSLQERLDLGCVTEREDPEEPRNPSPEPTPTEPEPTPEPAPSEDPEPEPDETPTPDPTEELAETGVDAWLVALVASLMVAAGITIKRQTPRF